MRLINTGTLELQDFTLKAIPRYAILSHTWGEDEVTFQGVLSRNVLSGKGHEDPTILCLGKKERTRIRMG